MMYKHPVRVRWKHGGKNGPYMGTAIHPETIKFNPSGHEVPGAYVVWDNPSILGARMTFYNLVFRVPCGRRVVS